MHSFENDFNQVLSAVKSEKGGSNRDLIPLIISLIDLTSLGLDDTPETITNLCKKANTKHGPVATVCIYPRFVALAKKLLSNTPIKIDAVVNFPDGRDPLELTLKVINHVIHEGAQEINLVWPYEQYLSGHSKEAFDYVKQAVKACHPKAHLKVILETGKLMDPKIIYKASREIIDLGVDFIKTSTGKVAINATLEAATAMLLAIRDSQKRVGFKAAGGIRTLEQAAQYVSIARHIMGKAWITPKTFRFGASALLENLLGSENC